MYCVNECSISLYVDSIVLLYYVGTLAMSKQVTQHLVLVNMVGLLLLACSELVIVYDSLKKSLGTEGTTVVSIQLRVKNRTPRHDGTYQSCGLQYSVGW